MHDNTGSLNSNSPTGDSRVFDVAERVLAHLRNGRPADVSFECRECPDLIPQVQSLVAAAVELEGLSARVTLTGMSAGGYRVVREIARGGMGVVYEARQQQLNRTVAFKMVLNADPGGLIRFLAEAEAVASVRHPNVVQVYESGQHEGQPYLAMEYCPGGTLAEKLKAAGKMPATAAVDLMAQVAAGVAAAHAEGIVHRDLKPGNVLFDATGVPKVADFGLAKRGAGADLTKSMAVMGTPAYMSPEQARGASKFVGPTTDVWALGVMLYECLTGKKPFDGENPMALLEQVKSGSVAGLRSSQRDVPRDVERIVQKCMATDPVERYPTAAELAADLADWKAGKPISARPAGAATRTFKWVKRNKAVAGSFTMVMIAMAAGTAISMWQTNEALYQKQQVQTKTNALAVSEADAREKAVELATQLKESRRLLDLSRLQSAQSAWDKNLPQLARNTLHEISLENRCVAWGLLSRRFEGSEFELRGHTYSVSSVAFSSDGRRVVTGSQDNTARIWDAATGKTLLELKGHLDNVRSVAISSDGRLVVTGSNDKTARVWDAATGQTLLKLNHSDGVRSVAISSDGRRIVTGSADKAARVWDAATGQMLRELPHSGAVRNVAISSDGRRIVTESLGSGGVSANGLIARGPIDNNVRVWDTATGQTLHEIRNTRGVTSVAILPDSGHIVTGSNDNTARIWDATTGKTLLELKGHTREVTSVAVSADGRRVVTGSMDHTARIWDASTGQMLLEFKGHLGEVTSVAVSNDGRRVATGSMDKAARVWDTVTGQTPPELKGHADRVISVAVSNDGRRIVTGSMDKTARVWDVATDRKPLILKGHLGEVISVAVSADGRWVITGSSDKTARVWDMATRQNPLELKGHSDRVISVAVTADGRRVVTGSLDKTARVWDTATGQSLRELKHTRGVTSVAILPDSGHIVTGSNDNTARIWDALTGQTLLELKGHTREVNSVAVSADGSRIITGSDDKTARIWDASTGQSIVELKGHSGGVRNVAFSSDGRRVVTLSAPVIVTVRSTDGSGHSSPSGDRTARIWDAATGQTLVELRDADRVNSIAFMADGSRIVTGSSDSTVRIWEAETRLSPIELKGHSDSVTKVTVTADGHRIVSGSLDKTTRVWDAMTGQMLLELKGHAGAVTGIVISADGRRIVTASFDKTARIWDAMTGETVAELKGHANWVTSVAVSADGRRVATGSADKTARVWDMATGRMISELKGHTTDVKCVAFSMDGRRVITESGWTYRAAPEQWVWDGETGKRAMEPIPVIFDHPNQLPDGRLTYAHGDIVEIFDPKVPANEINRRQQFLRPDPEYHAQQQKQCRTERNDYGEQLHRVMEQEARGHLALEAFDFHKAQMHFMCALILKSNNEYKEKRVIYEKLHAAGDIKSAVEAARELVKIQPQNPSARNELRHCLSLMLDHKGAIEACREAIRLDPKNDYYHLYLGGHLSDIGDRNGAIICYRKCLELNPKMARAHEELAKLLRANGDNSGAEAAEKSAKKLQQN